MKNFVIDNSSDYDRSITVRSFYGRMTDKRREIITNYVEQFNESHSAPYGVSPNGYAYRCGCEHDCCGCLSRDYMDIELKPLFNTGLYDIKLTRTQTFNY